MSTTTPTPRADSAAQTATIHGFSLPEGTTADTLEHWPQFAEYFERKEGFYPSPTDSRTIMLFEYYVEGAFRELLESQGQVTAMRAELRMLLPVLESMPEAKPGGIDWGRLGAGVRHLLSTPAPAVVPVDEVEKLFANLQGVCRCDDSVGYICDLHQEERLFSARHPRKEGGV